MDRKTMCAWCKRIKEPGGNWEKPEEQPDLGRFNHGICMECAVEFFGNSEEED